MKSIFKNPFAQQAKQSIQVVEEPKKQSIKETIEEIHETFYTEVDRLLAEAKISSSLDTNKQHLIEKCSRLKALGFTNTKEVKEAESELQRIENLKKENEAKKILVKAINYFSVKYPNYKFITEESVKKICEKYNLVYGAIDRYLGTVPEKNLKHIEDFSVIKDDECYVHEEFYSDFHIGRFGEEKRYQTFREYKSQTKEVKFGELGHLFALRESLSRKSKINMKCPLEIAAPIKDFNMQGMEVKSHKISKIEIPDPIVLKPVIFEGQKHFLIVTAWGDEASDELVVNQKMN